MTKAKHLCMSENDKIQVNENLLFLLFLENVKYGSLSFFLFSHTLRHVFRYAIE